MVLPMRAEIRIIQDQEIEIKEAEISQTEKEMLLAKYGFGNAQIAQEESPKNTSNLTFEEMCDAEESRLNAEKQERIRKLYGPKPITFDNSNYYSNENYGTDDGITFKVSIVSDMPLPK